MSATAFVWLQHLLPQRLLGACVRAFATTRKPWIKRPLIRWFANHYAVDLSDAARSRLADYATFNEFFTRELCAGARPITTGDTTIVSPADGRVTQFGVAEGGQALQAKGMAYALDELLGAPPPGAASAHLGSFVTIYLAPNDYHRVHLPLGGTLSGLRYVPGRRFSVNAATTSRIPRLFCRNERVIVWFTTAAGPMALALVGALNVAGISTPWLGELRGREEHYWDGAALASAPLARGDEIGRFNLGSTVIVVLPINTVTWHADLAINRRLRVGEGLGSVLKRG